MRTLRVAVSSSGQEGSTLFSALPFGLALNQVPIFLADEAGIPNEGPLTWHSVPEVRLQQNLVRHLPSIQEDITVLREGECFGAAAWTAEAINAILASKGFEYIRLDPWKNPEEFGIAGGVDFDWQWLANGQGAYRVGEDGLGFRLSTESSLGGINIYMSSEQPVAAIPTKGYDYVLVTDAFGAKDKFELLEACAQTQRMMVSTQKITGAIFPQWKISEKIVDVSSLRGLRAVDSAGNDRIIEQAKFGGDASFHRDGASFRAAVAMSCRKGLAELDRPSPEDYVFGTREGVVGVYVWYIRGNRPQTILGAAYMPRKEYAKEDVLPKARPHS